MQAANNSQQRAEAYRAVDDFPNAHEWLQRALTGD